MTCYVEISVSLPQARGTFDYHLPPELEERVTVGHLVTVPFGRQTIQGVVLRKIASPSVPETRAVLDLVDPAAVLTAPLIALAYDLAEQTLAPLSACIDLMVPPGLAQHADTLYTARQASLGSSHTQGELSEIQVKLLHTLSRRGELRGAQIDHAFPHLNWRPAMRGLVKRGLVSAQSVLPPPKVRPKFVRTVQLACSPEEAERAMPGLARQGTQALQRRQAMLRFLMHEAGPIDVTWVYAESQGNLQDLYALADPGLVILGETEVWRDPLQGSDYQLSYPPVLTKDQAVVWEALLQQFRAAAYKQAIQTVLLHGVTGSGKTEIYMRAVQETLQAGKQAIILVPEIALTPQTVRRFASRFPGKIGLFHSRLSMGERYDTWRRARNGNLSVVIGPRSALFTPFPDLGLIVVDECQDDSYYQSDVLPYYHASQAATTYARLTGAVCILGSATPDLTVTYGASQGHLRYLHLPARILAHRQAIRSQVDHARLSASQYRALEGEAETIELPAVHVVDMRQELRTGNRSIFSQQLQDALEKVLQQNQQAILFLNRRGTATYIFCRDCGHTLKCPRCDLPLTYHLEQAQTDLRCHYCGYQRKLPNTCPECGSRQIRHYGAGTERVEAELIKLFPQARPLRWDYETTRQKGSHEVILAHFAAQRADILIGTQMIAKGLDLPLVTLVGVILADVGLNLPDYRAAERTFQVLTQVAGRAGRSPLGGQVLLQTFQPEHYVIKAAAQHSYREFYQRELEYRKRLGYPPYSRLVRLEFHHPDPKQAELAANNLASKIRGWLASVTGHSAEIIGPVPCFFQRQAGQYRWQIVLRGPDPVSLLKDHPLDGWKIEVNPPNLL
jgi:primosomal protein N' (replication factor Y) (superfamily II helicase)